MKMFKMLLQSEEEMRSGLKLAGCLIGHKQTHIEYLVPMMSYFFRQWRVLISSWALQV